MRINQFRAFVDACVLVPMPVADTLLRFAEAPAFYAPKWSADVMREVERTLVAKPRYSAAQAARRVSAMQEAFPDAMVDGYEDLIPAMRCDEKDRHVLAAAVRCGANAIVSDNKRHFPAESLLPYGLDCLTADEFIEHQYHLDPDGMISVLWAQAQDIGRPLSELIRRHVPCLARLIHQV